MSAPKWVQAVIGEDGATEAPRMLKPFSIAKATDAQEAAIRGLATQAGFETLRGFWSWVKSAALDYYDLIKVASPE